MPPQPLTNQASIDALQLAQGDKELTFSGNALALKEAVAFTGGGHNLRINAHNGDTSKRAFRFDKDATFTGFSSLTFVGTGDTQQNWVVNTGKISLGTQESVLGALVFDNLALYSWQPNSQIDIYARTLDAANADLTVGGSFAVHQAGEQQTTKLRKVSVNKNSTFVVESGSLTIAGDVNNQGTVTLGQETSRLTSVDFGGPYTGNGGSLTIHADDATTKNVTLENKSTVEIQAKSLTTSGVIRLNGEGNSLALATDTTKITGQLINQQGTVKIHVRQLDLTHVKGSNWDGTLASSGGAITLAADKLSVTGSIMAEKSGTIEISAPHTEIVYEGTLHAINATTAGSVRFTSTAADSLVSIRAEKGSGVLTSKGGEFAVAGGSVDIAGTVQANEGGKITLGTTDRLLESVKLTGTSGPLLLSNGGTASVAAKQVSVTNSTGNAVEVFNRGLEGALDSGTLNIYAENSLSIQGDVVSGFNGNDRKVSADTSLTIGGATDAAVTIDGDVTSYNDGEGQTSNKVTINLTNEKSSLKGTVVNQNLAGERVTTGGTSLGLSNNAHWEVTGDSNLSDITSAEGRIDLADGKVKVGTLTNGTGGTLVSTDKTEAEQLVIGSNQGAGLKLELSGKGTDTLTGNAAADRETLKNLVQIEKSDAGYEIDALEGTIIGSSSLVVNKDGTTSYTEQVNTVTAGLEDIAASNFLAFRAQTNDLQKRMGDLRTMPQTDGAWARYFGGKNKYGDRGLKNRYDSVQIGVDHRFTAQFLAGLTFGYTKNDGTLTNGTSDVDNFHFGVYGSWLGDDGQFVDVTLKRHRLDTDYDLTNSSGTRQTGSYDTWGTSLSVEYGWRLGLGQTAFYVEPQVEFTMGRLDRVSYTTSARSTVTQKAVETYVGRIGAAAGYVFPDNAGSVYVKASLLHDWAGSLDGEVSFKGQRRTFAADLGGTWGEFVLGGSYNVNNRWSVYGEVQTTTGSPVENPWQASVGLRWSF